MYNLQDILDAAGGGESARSYERDYDDFDDDPTPPKPGKGKKKGDAKRTRHENIRFNRKQKQLRRAA